MYKMAKLVDLDGLKYFYSKIKAMLALKADDSAVVKSVNGTTPDASGNVSVTVSGGGGGVSTDTANTWTAAQTFNMLGMGCEFLNDTTITPTMSMMFINVDRNAVTLDLSKLVAQTTSSLQFEYIFVPRITEDITLKIKGVDGVVALCALSDIAINGQGNVLVGKIIKNDSANIVLAVINAQKIIEIS